MSESAPIEHPSGLTSGDLIEADEPLRLFAAWFEQAARSEPRDPTAMSLATVGADGLPNVRMVLMKGFGEAGFVFYTNVDSQKGHELDREQKAALLFHWKSANRQVRLRGPVERIGAWASKQSAPLESPHAFEKAIAYYVAKFGLGTVPRPPNWTGYRLRPLQIEFWQERPFRLHDRLEFRREALDTPWHKARLYP